MRIERLAIGICLLATIGCLPSFVRKDKDEFKPVDVEQSDRPTAKQLISWMNGQAAQIDVLHAESISIDVKVQGSSPPTVRGWMICQKPLNFRMVGKVLGISQVDFGSNSERFWYWVKESPDQAVVHCSHEDFRKGTQMPFPFQPEWVLEALGMSNLDPEAKNFEVEVRERTFELIESTTSPQGKPVKKVTVFDRRRNLTPTSPRVKVHQIRDAQDRVICSATIQSSQMKPYRGTETMSVPREVLLEWPEQRLSMLMTLDDVELNKPPTGRRAKDLFTLPEISGYKSIDIARQSMKPTSRVQPVTGTGTYRP